jgi:hypothetical protein
VRPVGPVSRDDAMEGSVPGDPGEGLSPGDAAFLDRIARWLAQRSLTVPSVLFLESTKPLNFVGSQALFFFEPMVKILVGGKGYTRFARLMEERDNVEELLRRIEAAEQDVRSERDREKSAAAERKKSRSQKTKSGKEDRS